MGRNMFGGGDGAWDETWRGWWGEDPPYHAPVFVLTHHAREPLEMEGGTTFHFVTDGIESALEQARAAAGDKDVCIAGGASVVQQYLRAGLRRRACRSTSSPVLLGGGARLFDAGEGLPEVRIERVVASPNGDAPEVRRRAVSRQGRAASRSRAFARARFAPARPSAPRARRRRCSPSASSRSRAGRRARTGTASALSRPR